MTQAQAIFLGALVIAASLLITNGTRPAVALGNGPFQLMNHSNTTANVGVFRIDTSSGEVSYCFVTASNELVCSHSVK